MDVVANAQILAAHVLLITCNALMLVSVMRNVKTENAMEVVMMRMMKMKLKMMKLMSKFFNEITINFEVNVSKIYSGC